jgi:hypothetical protein
MRQRKYRNKGSPGIEVVLVDMVEANGYLQLQYHSRQVIVHAMQSRAGD